MDALNIADLGAPKGALSEDNKHQVHYIAVTGIIRKDDKYLICKRGPHEKLFPNKWCVPGGKLEHADFISTPKGTSAHWLGIFEKVLEREIKEETGLLIKNIRYVSSLVFMRGNGYSTVVVSMCAQHAAGDVTLNKDELADYAWVSLDDLKNYDLIDNIAQQIHNVADQQI